jgi:hypothetical protein
MGKKDSPPPPDILRKSGPHKDRTRYDRRRAKDEERRQADEARRKTNRPD